jgi:hypothetical protein
VAAAAIAERGRMGEEALDYLKSGLTSLGESDEVALIESFVRRRRIAGDDWMDEAAWTAARRRDEGRSGAELFAAWSRAAAPLVRCVGRLRSGEGADPARALWSLLDELGAAARMRRGSPRRAREAMKKGRCCMRRRGAKRSPCSNGSIGSGCRVRPLTWGSCAKSSKGRWPPRGRG